jgi:hypothetical protein
MNMVLISAILVISAMPSYAQDHPNIAKLKADAENVVRIISGDKAKIKTYCEFADLNDQIYQANQEQDAKKAEGLSHRAEERKLGPEFAALDAAAVPERLHELLRRTDGRNARKLHLRCHL